MSMPEICALVDITNYLGVSNRTTPHGRIAAYTGGIITSSPASIGLEQPIPNLARSDDSAPWNLGIETAWISLVLIHSHRDGTGAAWAAMVILARLIGQRRAQAVATIRQGAFGFDVVNRTQRSVARMERAGFSSPLDGSLQEGCKGISLQCNTNLSCMTRQISSTQRVPGKKDNCSNQSNAKPSLQTAKRQSHLKNSQLHLTVRGVHSITSNSVTCPGTIESLAQSCYGKARSGRPDSPPLVPPYRA
ncbi:hypothetical protein BKA70DRAFT_1216143 [Coprinopsis sp. MPI-PUGE-AT-0042]|nr:hypothetical protein BKA70DRAFT_1216143 [Coprinopsis sp. MPI-PUGE-AT-0042]